METDDIRLKTGAGHGRRGFRRWITGFTLLCFWVSALPVRAEPVATGNTSGANKPLMVQVGPFVYHRVYSREHNNWPLLVGAEWGDPNQVAYGGAAFRNSFYQPSLYLYAAKRWFVPAISDNVYLKLSGGPLYGYRGKYEDKVPFNHNGFGLAVLPAVGYQSGRTNFQAVLLGTAAVIFTVGYTLD